MQHTPIVVERVYDAPVHKVWAAITQKELLKQWYFTLDEFKPIVGFEFQFAGKGSDGQTYLHLSRVTEVLENQKLSYTWRYANYEGDSLVTFELFEESGKTRLRLTHTGLETFPQNKPDFDRKNFNEGWQKIIGTNLKNFVEKSAS